MIDGGWIGDPESTPCEMGGGPLVDYGLAEQPMIHSGNQRGGKMYGQAVKFALQIASGAKVAFVCNSEVAGKQMANGVEAVLRWAGLFPTGKYMKRFSVHTPGRGDKK